MTDHSESAAANLTNGHGTPRPVNTVARRQPPIDRDEITKLARVIATELGQALKRLDKLERACGLSHTEKQPGVEAIAPVIRNFIEARLRPIEATVHDLDNDVMRYRDIWEPDRTYQRGTVVTLNGGWWLARETTDTRPGKDGSWKLTVKSTEPGRPRPREAADET